MVSTRLFGEKEVFAIEVSCDVYSYSDFGYLRIWVNGTYIGTLEDGLIVGTAFSVLHEITKGGFNETIPIESGLLELKNSYINSDGFYARQLLGLGESFDDFLVTYVKDKEKVIILWSLFEEPYFEYKDYPKGKVFEATILIKIIKSVLNEIDAYLRKKQT